MDAVFTIKYKKQSMVQNYVYIKTKQQQAKQRHAIANDARGVTAHVEAHEF